VLVVLSSTLSGTCSNHISNVISSLLKWYLLLQVVIMVVDVNGLFNRESRCCAASSVSAFLSNRLEQEGCRLRIGGGNEVVRS